MGLPPCGPTQKTVDWWREIPAVPDLHTGQNQPQKHKSTALRGKTFPFEKTTHHRHYKATQWSQNRLFVLRSKRQRLCPIPPSPSSTHHPLQRASTTPPHASLHSVRHSTLILADSDMTSYTRTRAHTLTARGPGNCTDTTGEVLRRRRQTKSYPQRTGR